MIQQDQSCLNNSTDFYENCHRPLPIFLSQKISKLWVCNFWEGSDIQTIKCIILKFCIIQNCSTCLCGLQNATLETVKFILLFCLITEIADMLQPNTRNMDHAHTSFPETLLRTTNYKYGNHTKGEPKKENYIVRMCSLHTSSR